MAKKIKELKARQGEILIYKDDNFYAWQKGVPVPGNVIREGEKSGHKHEVTGDGQLAMFGDQMVCTVGKGGAKITHPEHGPITLPEGKYRIDQQREFDGKETNAKD